MSKICRDINLQNVGAGDCKFTYVFMTDIHVIGLKIGLKRHKFVSKRRVILCLVFLGMLQNTKRVLGSLQYWEYVLKY